MTRLLTELFPGADGATWPAHWTLGNGTATIQGGKGQFSSPASAFASGDVTLNSSVFGSGYNGDFDLYTEATITSTIGSDDVLAVFFNQSGGSYYSLTMLTGASLVWIRSYASYSGTTQASSAFTYTTGDTLKVRLIKDTGVISAYLWTSGSQPGSPTVTWTDVAPLTTDYIRLEVSNSGDTEAVRFDFDNLTLDSVGAGPPTPSPGFWGLMGSSVPTGASPTEPGQVTLSANVGDTQVSLVWSAPSTGGSAITDYETNYKLNSSGTWIDWPDDVVPGAIVTGLTNGSLYDFRVRAINAIGAGAWSSTVQATPISFAGVTQWAPLAIGGGGWLTGHDMVPGSPGTLVTRTDTYGMYKWNSGTNAWEQMLNSTSMPVEDQVPGFSISPYELRIAPSNTNRYYMALGTPLVANGVVYRSDNSGVTWVKTALTGKVWNPMSESRWRSYFMAVDPQNADVCMVGVPQDGVYYTDNAGTSWSKIASIPASDPGGTIDRTGGYHIAFDPVSTVTSGKLQRVYVTIHGVGVYKSTDGAATFSSIGGPTCAAGVTVSTNGNAGTDSTVFICDTMFNVGPPTATMTGWRWKAGAWTQPIAANVGNEPHAIAISPGAPNTVTCVSMGGSVRQSVDDGVTWSTPLGGTRSDPTIPWLEWTGESWLQAGNMTYHPSVANRIILSQGIGFWYADLTGPSQGSLVWQGMSKGIEQLVTTEIFKNPGGPLILAVEDRLNFVRSDSNNPATLSQFPARHFPQETGGTCSTWGGDLAHDGTYIHTSRWDTRQNAGKATGDLTNNTNWVEFATFPTAQYGYGGCISVDPNNSQRIVWAGNGLDAGQTTWNESWPYYSNDGGSTWTICTFPGITALDLQAGPAFGRLPMFMARRIVTCDEGGNFFLYCWGGGTAHGGIWRRVAGQDAWVHVASEPVSNADPTWPVLHWAAFNSQLRAVPGQTGHLFMTAGPIGSTPDTITEDDFPFIRSTDGGVTWAAVPNVKEVYCFGWGKPPSGVYPSMYLVGWVSGTYGVWRSDNVSAGTPTWTNIGTFPNGSLDTARCISGDPDVIGRVYLGTSGMGFLWRQTV